MKLRHPIRWTLLLIVVALVGGALFVPMFTGTVPSSQWADQSRPSLETIELAKLKGIGVSLIQYAIDHSEKFPARIADASLAGITYPSFRPSDNETPYQRSKFHDPVTKEIRDWLYFPGHTIADPPTTILAASPVPVPGGQRAPLLRIVFYRDGSAQIISEPDFQKAIATQHN